MTSPRYSKRTNTTYKKRGSSFSIYAVLLVRLLLPQVEIKQRLLRNRGEKLSVWLQQTVSFPARVIMKPFGSPGLTHTTADGVRFLRYGPAGRSSRT